MAIGTTAALLGSAIIGAGASAFGASSQSNAISNAGDAQLQASREALAAQGKARDDANQNLSPFITSGFNNLNVYNGLLGIPGYDQSTARDAFNNYLGASGFGYNMDEANKAANAGFYANGARDSGAAVKAAQDRMLNLKGNYLNNFLGLVNNQQQIGAGAASASAGVSQNFGNNVSNITTNQGNNAANLALMRGQNTNNLLGNLSSSFGLGLGALSGFGGGGSVYGGNLGGIY